MRPYSKFTEKMSLVMGLLKNTLQFRSGNIACLVLFCGCWIMMLNSCKKGTLLEGEQYMKVSVGLTFNNNDLDLYVNDQLASNGLGQTATTVKQKTEMKIALYKKGTRELLKDTTVKVSGTELRLIYAYSPEIGFNQFVKPGDFVRPSQDSLAYIFVNKFTGFGSGKINIYIYAQLEKSYTAEDSQLVAEVKDLPLGGKSDKLVFPAKDANGNALYYNTIVKDAVTGQDGYWEYISDYGLVNFAGMYIYDDIPSQPGLINGIAYRPFVFNDGSKQYTLPEHVILFQF